VEPGRPHLPDVAAPGLTPVSGRRRQPTSVAGATVSSSTPGFSPRSQVAAATTAPTAPRTVSTSATVPRPSAAPSVPATGEVTRKHRGERENCEANTAGRVASVLFLRRSLADGVSTADVADPMRNQRISRPAHLTVPSVHAITPAALARRTGSAMPPVSITG